MKRQSGIRRAAVSAATKAFRAVERLESRQLMHAGGGAGTIEPEAASFEAFGLTAAEAAAPSAPLAAAVVGTKHSLSSIPALSSRPGAPATLYLDFDGDTTATWGSFSPGTTPAMDADGDPTTFSDGELATIRETWARVSEDFSPFNLNVTTVDPGSYADRKATRAVIGGKSDWYGSPVAGLSYVGAFSNEMPNLSFVFVNGSNAAYMADIVSHEAGHSFGLGHQEVYNADGTLADAYADGDSTSTPIMGGGGGRAVWWRGDSGRLGLVQDDADVIASADNGFGYRADDHGNSPSTPTALTWDSASGAWTGSGVIETLTDRDWFSFSYPTVGDTIITVKPVALGPDLNAKVELRTAAGALLATYDSADLGESFSINLPAGDYRVGVMSHGKTGDLGQYSVSVSRAGVTPTQTQEPFGVAPTMISSSGGTTIQAEDFDRGGEGVAYHDTDTANTGGVYRPGEGVDLKAATDGGAGYRLSDTRAGEWVKYTVNVAKAGTYKLELRVSNSKSGGKLHVEAAGANVSGSLTVPSTGGFNAFTTISKTVTLAAGPQVVRVAFDALPAGGDSVAGLNWIRLTPATAAASSPTPVRVASTKAAYVREGSSTTNYGSDSKLAVKGSTTGASRESYLKFDLSSLPATITSATLRLYGNLSASVAGGVGLQVFAAADKAWDEKKLTWQNRPGATGGALASFTVSGTSAMWYEINLTAFLQSQKVAGKTSVTLVLKGVVNTSPYAQFNSDDAGSNRPELVVRA